MKGIKEVKGILEGRKERSAWNKGVKEYALELLKHLENENLPITEKNMLNGAENWNTFSYGGCSMIYDGDIAKRLCNPSELKKTKNGQLQPNSRESWLDVQARALYQASRKILELAK